MPKLPRSTSSATSSMASGTIPSRPAKPHPDRLKIMHLFPDGPLDDPRGSPALAFGVIVVAVSLLHGAVLGLLHRPNQRNAAPGRLGQVARAQPVRTEFNRIEAGARGPLLQDQVHRLSSNSVVGQRMAVSLGVELSNRFVDGAVEIVRSG